MDKFFLKPTKYKNDDNNSFQFFRSFITLYYCLLFTKKNDHLKYFKNIYKSNKYFNLFKNEFINSQNPLIFTYFNNIPYNFYPIFTELHYYYPIITFFNSNKFYQKGQIKLQGPKDFFYQYNLKISKEEIQITIPINLISEYKLPNQYYSLIKSKDKLIAASSIKVENDSINILQYKIKNDNYNKSLSNLIIPISEIEFINFLIPITKEGITNSFKLDTIKKNAILYYVLQEEYNPINEKKFFTLIPKLNPFNIGYTLNADWTCVRNILKKDLTALNIAVDIFYNNEIVNRKTNNKFIDYRDEKYETEMEDELFRCYNYDNVMNERTDICNYNWMKDYGKATLFKNSGKKMIYLLVYKNFFLSDNKSIYYLDFIKNFNFTAMINHYGYIQYKDNKKFFDLELAFTDAKYTKEYVETLDVKKGDCKDLYKRGSLKKNG